MITMNGYDGKDVELLMDVDGVGKKHTHTLLTGFYTGVRTTVLGDISFLLFLAETIERTTIPRSFPLQILAPQLPFGIILAIFTMYFQSNQQCLLKRETFPS